MYTYLQNNFSFSPRDLKITVPVLSALVFFIIYWFTAQSDRIKKIFYKKYDHDKASYRHILFTKYTGFITMGFFPALICILVIPDFSLESIGLYFNSSTWFFSLVWICALSLIVVPLAFFSAKNPKNWVNYPQIRARFWSNKMLIMNGVGWFVYLFGYEFLFRGVLLFPLVEDIGIWPAIAVNIAMYSATHIPKGLDETLGAIPLGLVLCLLTLASGTIWIAFLVHVAMAWTNSYTSFYFNPLTNHESTKGN
ncbi:MAG: CPBP family intramembrane metalloprotease [Crocinitomicaceae bacterium]|nr:CPBP family intramembrane metalloprotease [Crocinitomicaceae bacterium]